MKDLENRIRLDNEDYRLPVSEAIEQNDQDPVSGGAVYEWLRGLANVKDREVADIVAELSELSDSLSRALITEGAIVTYCAQLHHSSRHLTTLLPLDILHVFDKDPSAGLTSTSRFDSDTIKKSAYTGQACYEVVNVNNVATGRRVHAYAWDGDNSRNKTHTQALQPGKVYYVKYFTLSGSTVTEDRTKWGLYEANNKGILQLTGKLPV